MTYVTEQTPAELRAHMRRLQAMPGWHNPLDDRLFKEVVEQDKEIERLRAATDVTGERQVLRAQQATAVMPQIGPLLDAWEGIDNDTKGTIREEAPELVKWLGSINRAMTDDAHPTHQG